MTTEFLHGVHPDSHTTLEVGIQHGLIVSIEEMSSTDCVLPYLSAGLIDLQINGYAGLDLNSKHLTSKVVIDLCRKLGHLGVTSSLPTQITSSPESTIAALKVISTARKEDWLAKELIAGVHMESPSVSAFDGSRGVHPLQLVRAASLQEYREWQEASDNLVVMVTIAPEQAGAIDYIKVLSAQKITIAISHSAATAEQVKEAVQAGASMSTHLGNGVAAIRPRHPDLIWAQIADEHLFASFIADSRHLLADTFKVKLNARGLDQSILVSDSVTLAGMPVGRYKQAIGGTVEVSPDGRIVVVGTPYLAGAGLPLSSNILVAMQIACLSLNEALRLATINLGQFINGRG